MTDGYSTTGGDPVAAAAATKAVGIRIVTIGLGNSVDEQMLRAIASSPDDYFQAPAPGDLGDIYDGIVRNIACEAEGTTGLSGEAERTTILSLGGATGRSWLTATGGTIRIAWSTYTFLCKVACWDGSHIRIERQDSRQNAQRDCSPRAMAIQT